MKEEWETCIARNHAEHENESLCGRKFDIFEFHFTGLDHWLNNRLMKGRLVGCRECLAKLSEVVESEEEIWRE